MNTATKRIMVFLITCVAVMAFIPGAPGKDKLKTKQTAKAPILAIATDGSVVGIVGEAKFSAADTYLEVSIDMASGVPNARVKVTPYCKAIPYEPSMELILTDDRGDLKWVKSYYIDTQEPFEVWIEITVTGALTNFQTDDLNPVTVDPKG